VLHYIGENVVCSEFADVSTADNRTSTRAQFQSPRYPVSQFFVRLCRHLRKRTAIGVGDFAPYCPNKVTLDTAVRIM
jgi:hypothetical protein